jgi:hypothetical protein
MPTTPDPAGNILLIFIVALSAAWIIDVDMGATGLRAHSTEVAKTSCNEL